MANIGRNLTRKLSANLNVRSSFQKNVNNLDLYHGNDLIINAINKSPCFNSTPDSLYYVLLYGYELLPAVRTFMSGNSRTLFGDSLSAGQLIKNTMNTLDASVNSVNLAGKYMISENLFINASSSATFRNNYYNSFNYIYPYERVVYSNDVIGGYTEVYFKSSEHYILLNQQLSINYFKNFNKHDIKCTIGYRNYADNANWKLDSIYNKGDYGDQSWYSDYYFSYLKSPLASNANSGSITRLIQSFAANLNYNYNRKYYLSFILNRENLKVNDLVNISNWFPSVAINWDISKEQIFTRPGWLNQFNLYGNWGRSGNYPVNALADNKYSEYQYTFNDTITNGKSVTQFANHHLKSEISNEYNAGTNLNLFNNRIILTADYYTKINSGLIIMRDIPYYYLGGTMMYNIGKISNHGWEFNLELEPVRTKNFNWYSVFAISFNRQKVINIGNEEQINFNSTDILFPDMVISENQALGNILGYKYLGEWTAKDNADNKHQVNSNGSKYLKVDTTTYDINHKDKIILGKSIPDYTWNWSNTFRYKNFFIDLLWYGVMGVSKFNSTKASTYMACTNREVTEFMQPGRKTLTDTVFYQSSYFVENASFIRLKRATISYLIPRKIFKYGDIKLSLSFENVFTFTHYTGYDPEASIYTNNSFSDFAVDRGAYPNPRSIFFTIKLEL
jgi:TonB-dependent starch-binding outer membrane protein SusC